MAYLPNINRISTLNSSTATLTAGSTFTGTWEDVTLYNSIVVAIKTDQNGTFTVQFSPDGVNVDSTLTRYYQTTQIEAPHRFTITRQYCRVTFENTSASAQTLFRLQSTFGEKSDLNAPIDSTLAQDFDSIIVRPTNYHYEVALGLRQGHTTWNKWGYNEDIDIGTETVWSVGGLFVELTTARTLSIVSTDANDVVTTGTGAQSIVVTGIDANRDAQVEVVSMNGLTPVVTTSTWLGINRMAVYLAGSSGYNEGKIQATATTDLTVQGEIPIQEGSTQQAFYFTHRGHTALIDWLLINVVKTSGGQSPVVTIKMWITSLVSGAKYEVFRENIDVALDNNVELNPSQPFVVGEQSLIEVEATTDTNDTAVSARFSFIEIRGASTQ
jgi:hypothetical protein